MPARLKPVVCLAVCATLAWPVVARASTADDEPPRVEAVEILNTQFLQKDTLLFYVSTKPGDLYDERRLRDDFRRLWDTGFLDDLQVEERDGVSGKIVSFRVSERKRVQIVDYRGSKTLTHSSIEDELKKRDVALKIDTFYDPAKARRVEEVIKQMLDHKGRPFAKVTHDAKAIGGAGQQVSFVIDDGPKVKVKTISFDGNDAFSDRALRARLKKVKPIGFWNLSWLGDRNTYTEDKWTGAEDDPRGEQGRLEDFYLNHGYVQVRVGQPKVSYTEGKSGLFKKGPVKWMTLEVPVSEGPQYRVGEVKFEGLTVLKEAFVRPLFKVETGDVYDEGRLKKGFDKLRDLYGSVGYFQWTGAPHKKPDPEKRIVDVTLAMEEDKRYFVGHINFTGNQSTRDKVIRREIYMNEGDVFNTEALKQSIRRVNQLGYFRPMEGAPQLQPNGKHDDQIDVTFKVEEQNRNQFTFGGGVSGLEGAFLNASFQTSNFLGAGDTISLTAQTGSRTKNYQFAITKPYLFDRPITAGLDLFIRKITYLSQVNFVGYTQQDQGASVSTGFAVGRFSRANVGYSYRIIDLVTLDQSALKNLGYTTSAAPTRDATADVLAGIFSPPPTATTDATTAANLALFGPTGRRYESGVTPNWVRNTVDNPFMPRSGTRLTANFQFVGGPLGGTVSYYRPSFDAVAYHPVRKRMALGLHADIGYIRSFGTTGEIPYYLRYFLGGETQIRGYNVRTVSPLNATGAAIGGNKYMVFNAEYYFDVLGPLRLLLFFDAGEAFSEGQGLYWKTMRNSTGAEVRFQMPVLNVPFRLIYAINPNRDSFQPRTAFKFAVGTTF
jgi:outer membrane protein insertion porin family